MRYVLRALLAGGLGLAVAVLAACGGGSGLLSSDQASSLSSQLDQISTAVRSGQCDQAGTAVSDFSNQVDNLSGSGVNRRLVANLQQGASTLSQLASKNCHTTTTTTSSTTSSPTTTTSTTTSMPTTTSSSTTSAPTSTSSATSSSGTGSTPGGGGSGGAGLGGGAGAGGGTGGNGIGGIGQ